MGTIKIDENILKQFNIHSIATKEKINKKSIEEILANMDYYCKENEYLNKEIIRG